MELYGNLSRLYVPDDLKLNASLALGDDQAHYLKNVLRKSANDTLRLFNSRDGEFIGTLEDISKKGARVTLTKQIRTQPSNTPPVHLLFAPLKKDRMDFLVEKAVELGVTDLHPVITARTEVREPNETRIRAQIIEAAEQCERMSVPVLHPATPLLKKIAAWNGPKPLYWCFERSESAPHIAALPAQAAAFIIGPAGGFDENEARLLASHESVKQISLGQAVYRAETAAFLCLGAVLLKNQK
jgi:16S rRNA (uracil1498-N3)-methyltransferase